MSQGLPEPEDFGGFDLAIGSVFAVRWFGIDRMSRLRGVAHPHIWTPGENVATCWRDAYAGPSVVPVTHVARVGGTLLDLGECDAVLCGCHERPIEPAAPRATHAAPWPDCQCGFYAYAEGCEDGLYAPRGINTRVLGVVECYGRTVIGTRGLRAEKAAIRGLATSSAKLRHLYPDVLMRPTPADLLAEFDVVQPVYPTPANTTDFWTRRLTED